MRSKIHKATVTSVNLDYEGSIGIDKSLLKKAGIFPGEKVLVADSTNGARLETYTIEEKENSGRIAIYGAAAHLVRVGDKVIIMGFELAEKPVKIKKILVDKNNKFIKLL